MQTRAEGGSSFKSAVSNLERDADREVRTPTATLIFHSLCQLLSAAWPVLFFLSPIALSECCEQTGRVSSRRGARGRTESRQHGVQSGSSAPREIPQVERLMNSLGHREKRSARNSAVPSGQAAAGTGGPMTRVSSEIARAKAAAKRADARARRVEKKLWAKGSKAEERAQDRYSSSMRDTNEEARQRQSTVVKRFS